VDRWITDYQPSPRHPVYTRAHAGEMLAAPCSPLGQTLVFDPGIVEGWRDSQLRIGTFEPGELEPWECVGFFGGYLYVNADVTVTVPDAWLEGPADPDDTDKHAAWVRGVLATDDLPALREDRDAADAARASRPDLAASPDDALVERARSLVPLVRQLFDRYMECTVGASVGPAVLRGVARELDDPSPADALVSAIGGVASPSSHAMWELSRQARHSAELTACFDAGVPALVDRLHASDSQECHEFLHELLRFSVRFGSCGPDEWDIRSDTWESRPELALAQIDGMRVTADTYAPSARDALRESARESVVARVTAALAGDPAALGQLQAGLRLAELYLEARERSKSNAVKVIHEMRMAVRELGARNGFTASATCMLLADELDAFASDPTEFRARLAKREEQYLALFELAPPFVIDGAVPPLDRWPRRTDAPPSADEVPRGTT
jgi:rifampicin phosphotransferase